MDSPIFGNHKPKVNSKSNGHSVEFAVGNRVYESDSPLEWQLSKKNPANNYSQLGNELKLAYVMLTLQKNFQALFFKVAKCLNKKKHEAFMRIKKHSRREMPLLLTEREYSMHSIRKQVNNPQTSPTAFVQICVKETEQRLQKAINIINRLQLKKLGRGWHRLTIYSLSPSPDHTGSTIMQQSTTLAISSSKLQSKKQLNSKKHAKQMKQNSLLNNGKNPQFESENQRLGQELTVDQMNLEKFTAKMNSLLAFHEGFLAGETTDRLSDGKDYHAGSMYSFQNHTNLNYHHHNNNKPLQGTKSQLYTKKK